MFVGNLQSVFMCWTMLFLPVMLCVGQCYFCRSCCVLDSLNRDYNIYKNINFVYIFPNNGHLSKVAFVIPHGLTVVGRFDCIWIDQNLQKLILEEIVFIILETFDGVTRSEVSCFQLYQGLSGWRSGITLGSHRCDPGSILGIGWWDGHVVTKSDRWVSSGYSGFLPHEDHQNQTSVPTSQK